MRNKDADQLRSNRASDQRFCYHYTGSAVPLLPKFGITNLKPSSVSVQSGLCWTWSEIPTTGFLLTRLICQKIVTYLLYSLVCNMPKIRSHLRLSLIENVDRAYFLLIEWYLVARFRRIYRGCNAQISRDCNAQISRDCSALQKPASTIPIEIEDFNDEPFQKKIFILKSNQRTNGPVRAHPISGPTIRTKTSFAKFDIVFKWVKFNSGSSFI